MSHTIPVSDRSSKIEYAIRDVVVPADKLEAEGHEIIKLNLGDPLAYPGLPTPDHMINAYKDALNRQYNGYSHSYGIPDLRDAISQNEINKENGGWQCSPDDIYVTTGVTEALQVLFATFLEKGDEVLSPGPHYPPYLAYPQMYGGKTIEYRLDPDKNWSIDIDDLKSKMNDRVKLLVLINPNNPTGNVISRNEIDEIISITSKYKNCTIISDEIYDRLNFKNDHFSTASRSLDVPVVTLNGVSKVYYAPGWRVGYMAFHDPTNKLSVIRDGVERLLRSRLCPSTPAQYGYIAGLKGDEVWMRNYLDSIIKRSNQCVKRINSISGLSVQAPMGSFYMFVKLTDNKWYNDDKSFVLSLLKEKHVLTVHGSGFSKEYGKGHFRIVFLPSMKILNDVFDRIDNFLNNS